jgi:hypothetical protein
MRTAIPIDPWPPRAPLSESRWVLRDFMAAAMLFAATAAVILWQNAHLVVLWDFSYVVDTAARIARGQRPYRDFPFVHAPLTFLIQAAIVRVAGRAFFHHVLYCAVAGGVGTVLAWRIALHTLRGRIRAAWAAALLLAAPLTVLGIYCILPHPSYDCDCALSVLAAVWMLQRLTRQPASGALLLPFAAGAAAALPLFFKQNIGLPFLLATAAAILLLLAWNLVPGAVQSSPGTSELIAVIAGMVAALAIAALTLQSTVGLGNYIHWTFGFAAQRRMPGLKSMMGVYSEPMLLWMLPCIVLALVLLHSRAAKTPWGKAAAIALLAAPFVYPLFALYLYDDADERGDSLLALWPLLLVLSAALTLWRLRRGPALRTLLPAIVLATVQGTLLSQQLWGSTYAIWPLLILLLAEMAAFLGSIGDTPREANRIAVAAAAFVTATLLVCGGFYTASEERLSYVQFPDEPLQHSTFAPLQGMATPGPYLPNFDELLRYAAANIPANDGLILLPGEDPFYFATGRVPQFPVLLFDPTTQPYTPAELAQLARARDIRWLVVKRQLQLVEDPTPQRQATLHALTAGFALQAHLRAYDVYRRP